MALVGEGGGGRTHDPRLKNAGRLCMEAIPAVPSAWSACNHPGPSSFCHSPSLLGTGLRALGTKDSMRNFFPDSRISRARFGSFIVLAIVSVPTRPEYRLVAFAWLSSGESCGN